MYVTNPSMNQYESWLKEKMKEESQSEILDRGIDLLGPKYIEENTTWTNYIIFSVYKTELPNSKVMTSVGIFKRFIPTSYGEESSRSGLEQIISL